MSLAFPASPSVGDTYTVGARTWTWSGTIWEITGTVAAAGSIGTTELADSAITTAKIAASPTFTGTVVLPSTTSIGTVSSTELGYVDGVTSAIQTQLDSKLTATTDVTSNRNVIINGAMQVAQRGTSTASITADGYYTADRWLGAASGLGTWTQSVEGDAPTGSGFHKSLKMLCTTANASPTGTNNLAVVTYIEGQNLQQFAKGTASAKQFALSFWVKSNVTGTYVAELFDVDNTRQTALQYTISSSATWEKKTLIFTADTTGAFDNDNAKSLQVTFWMGAGSGLTSGTLQTTWASNTTANRAVGQINLAAATSNYWQITGVQLEAGSVATPFEFEDYGVTLAKCQRYFQKVPDGVFSGYGNGTTEARFTIPLPVTLRSSPTLALSAGTSYTWKHNGAATSTSTSITVLGFNDSYVSFNLPGFSGIVDGYAITVSTNRQLTLSSEL